MAKNLFHDFMDVLKLFLTCLVEKICSYLCIYRRVFDRLVSSRFRIYPPKRPKLRPIRVEHARELRAKRTSQIHN